MDVMLCLMEDAKQEFLNVSGAVREAMIAKLVEISSRLPSSVSIQHVLEPQERADDNEIDEMDESTARKWFFKMGFRRKRRQRKFWFDGHEDPMEEVIVTHDEMLQGNKDEWCWVQEGNRHA